jgi:photosystem II stability/assembly factor-like uncharacterized protein
LKNDVYPGVSASSQFGRRPRFACAPLALAAVLCAPALAGAVVIKDNLYGVKALSATEVWTVGNFGSIYHTSDAGKTWEARESGTKSPLFAVDFADRTHGWAVGKESLILHTADGGRTWKPQRSPVSREKPLFGLEVIDPETVWVVGDWGAVAVTRDGGATWEDRSLAEDVVLYDVAFPDPTHGFIVGEFGTLLATTDGGATWEKREVGVGKTLFGVGFSSAERGWAVGMDGLILQTRDGGRSWTVQRGGGGSELLEDVGFMETLRNPGFYDVSVAGQFGIVIGDTGTLLTSADGGSTWSQHELPEKQRLTWMRSVSLDAEGHGFVVGAGGFRAAIDGGKLALPDGEPAATPVR